MQEEKGFQKIEKDIPYFDLRSGTLSSFYIRPLLRNVDPVQLREGPHRHNYQELLWIKSGSGRHKIDQNTLEIENNSFYFIAQGQVHYFIQGTELEGYLIRFTDDFLHDNLLGPQWNYQATLFSHFAIHHQLKIRESEIDSFQLIMDRMVTEVSQEAFGKNVMLRHLLCQLLIQLERLRRETRNDRPLPSLNVQLYEEFMNLLEANFRTEHQVRFYAQHLGMTARKLSDVVRKFSGKTAKLMIQERLLLEAKRYLHYTNASIKEIAFALGFQDPSYFSKVFRNGEGVAPHEFKRPDNLLDF